MRRFRHRAAAVVVGAVLAITGASPPAQAAGEPPVPLPTAPKGLRSPVTLPTALDPVAAYVPQVSCDPVDKLGATRLRNLLVKTYGVGAGGSISRGCKEGVSEHADGRAIDWMVDTRVAAQKAAAADFLSWVTRNDGENARRLGIMYVIYNQKIWAIYRAKEGWRPSSGHTDHVHISLSWAGARGDVSFWTGTVGRQDYGPCVLFEGLPGVVTSVPRTTPCPSPAPAVRTSTRPERILGDKGSSNVRFAQGVLGLSQTGTFDTATRKALLGYQSLNDVPRTGVLDDATYAAMDPATVDADAIAGVTRREAIAWGLARSASATVRPEATGVEAAMVQRALGLPWRRRTGYYGKVTTKIVTRLQAAHHLAQDGVMGAEEWSALAADVG